MGEELYELPQGWVWTTIGEATECLDYQRVPVSKEERAKRLGNIPYFGANGLVDYIDDYIFDEPLVLVVEDETFVGREKPFSYKITGKTWVNNHAHILRSNGCVDIDYLNYSLWYYPFTPLTTGTTGRRKLTKSALISAPYVLPPLPEQHRIVTKIEELFTQLDAGVELLKKVKAKLKRYRQAVLKAAVEGNLTKEWREANQGELEPASVLLERILKQRLEKWEAEQLAKMKAQCKTPKDDSWKLKYTEPVAPGTSDLPNLPDSWCYTFLKQCLPLSRGMKTGPFGSLLKKHEHQKEGIPVLGIENIAAMRFIRGSKIHITKEKAEELSGYDVQPGDILVSRSGTVGEVCVVPDDIGEARISTNLMRISIVPQSISPFFFCLLFNGSPYVLSQVSELCKGSTRNFLNQDILLSIVFPIPPFKEQQKIIEEVELLFSVIDQLEKTININLKRAERLRQTILKQAFEGKLVPQDPNDEPAEKLLKRIKAEKAKREADKKPKRQSTIKSKQPRKSKTTATQLELKLDD